MEVDETMITGHLDHARFSGGRLGRILNLLSRLADGGFPRGSPGGFCPPFSLSFIVLFVVGALPLPS